MLAYLILFAALASVVGIILILDRNVGKVVDQLVNSLPPRAQFFLLVLAVVVLAILWLIFGR